MIKKITVSIAAVCLLICAAFALWIFQNKSFLDNTLVTKEIFIGKGQGFSKLYEDLFGDQKAPFGMKEYLRKIKQVPQNMKFGYYSGENISLSSFLNNITNGVQSTVKVTVPEGANVFDIAKAVNKAGITSSQTFLDAAFDREVIRKITGGNYSSMEGFLFPGTYKFPKNFNEIKVLEAMYRNFKENLPPNFKEKAAEKGLTEYQALIVASIVQKETYKAEEAPLVASVFLNRLKINMPMQADPTILYGNFMRGRFEIKIDKKDLRDGTNEYNTYKIYGLTPTPISNPSFMALDAVSNPADTDFLYFVANKNGEHLFSNNYNSHRNYVNRYQKQ